MGVDKVHKIYLLQVNDGETSIVSMWWFLRAAGPLEKVLNLVYLK